MVKNSNYEPFCRSVPIGVDDTSDTFLGTSFVAQRSIFQLINNIDLEPLFVTIGAYRCRVAKNSDYEPFCRSAPIGADDISEPFCR